MKQESKAYTPEGISTATRTTRGFTMRMAVLTLATILLTATFIAPPALAAETKATTPADKPITLSLKDMSLADALTAIQDASGLRLVYAQELVKDAAPVTLEVKNQPTGSVLYDLLWERGLVPIYTSATVAAIVDEATNLGKAKRAGHASRELARLGKLFDGAELMGDEVVVPGWKKEDDRKLAYAIMDVITPLTAHHTSFMKISQQARANQRVEALASIMESFDKEVRIGAVMAANRASGGQSSSDLKKRIAASLDRMLNSDDPEVKAAGILTLQSVSWAFEDDFQQKVEEVVNANANDPSPEVRFSVILVSYRLEDEDALALLKKMQRDPSAVLRGTASSALLLNQARKNPQEVASAVIQAVLKEENPVAQMLCVFLCYRTGCADSRVQQVVQDNAWLHLVAGYNNALGEMQGLLRTKNGREQFAALQQKLTIQLLKLLTSGKRSHTALGAFFAMAHSARVPAGTAADRRSFLQYSEKLFTQAESDDLVERFFGIIGCCMTGSPRTNTIVENALQSNDVLDRIAGLLVASEARIPNLNYEKIVDAGIHSPKYIERVTAVQLISRMPFDQALAVFREQAGKNPGDPVVVNILATLRGNAALRGPKSEDNIVALLDAVTDTKNSELEVQFVNAFSLGTFFKSKPVVLSMIYALEPDALERIFSDKGVNSPFELRSQEFAARAILQRIRKMLSSEEGKTRVQGARILSAYGNRSSWFASIPAIKDDARKLAKDTIKEFSANDATPDQMEIACTLVPAIDANDVAQPLQNLLNRADEPSLQLPLAKLLKSLYERRYQFADAGLAAARDRAEEVILKEGAPEAQFDVLMARLEGRDKKMAASASAELQRRYIKSEFSENQKMSVVMALDNTKSDVTREFTDYLLKQYTHTEFRPTKFLAEHTDKISELVDIVVRDIENGKYFGDALNLGLGIRFRLSKANQKNGQPPAWATKAANAGLELAENKEVSDWHRRRGLDLYALSAGQKSAGKLVEMILDANNGREVRQEAAGLLGTVAGDSDCFDELAKQYHSIPQEVVNRFTMGSLEETKNNKSFQKFALCIIKDNASQFRSHLLMKFYRANLSAEFVTGLKELQNDAKIGSTVKSVLASFERRQKQENQ